MPFLPITVDEMREYGWERPDFVIVTGDAYVDHPSFGTAIISRVLCHAGYKVCIIPQPQRDGDYKRFGSVFREITGTSPGKFRSQTRA